MHWFAQIGVDDSDGALALSGMSRALFFFRIATRAENEIVRVLCDTYPHGVTSSG